MSVRKISFGLGLSGPVILPPYAVVTMEVPGFNSPCGLIAVPPPAVAELGSSVKWDAYIAYKQGMPVSVLRLQNVTGHSLHLPPGTWDLIAVGLSEVAPLPELGAILPESEHFTGESQPESPAVTTSTPENPSE